MRIVVISTYPKHGSMNIGDHLITSCVMSTLSNPGSPDSNVKVTVAFRKARWADIRGEVERADHVVFACLAIRPLLVESVYPTLPQIMASGVPFSGISSGTELPVGENDATLFEALDSRTMEVLAEFNERAEVFTTRGLLSQEFCVRNGLGKARFTGDIAFLAGRMDNGEWPDEVEGPVDVRDIVISDPHYAKAYTPAFERLLDTMYTIFPRARVRVALHGRNTIIEEVSMAKGYEVIPIYKSPEDGLGVYRSADLHVGFRVHGHVSALSHGRISYLAEQDGRGADYGATLSRRVSVPCYTRRVHRISPRGLIRRTLRRPPSQQTNGPVAAIDALGAIIRGDKHGGFRRFEGVGDEVRRYGEESAKALLNALHR